jgi:TIR domain
MVLALIRTLDHGFQMADIFVSYSHADRIKVASLVRALEARGWTTWSDRELIPGEVWHPTIRAELQSAGCVLVCWSASSIGSALVKEEAGIALAHEKLLPVSLDKTAPPKQFGSIETLDLSRWLGSDNDPNFTLLCSGIDRLLGHRETAAPQSLDKLSKNRSGIRYWGIMIGGTFFGVASGVIAKPLTAAAVLIVLSIVGFGGYVTYTSRQNSSQPLKPPPAVYTSTVEPLGRLRADPGQVSVSGIGSGAFMANQLHIAHSAGIMGAGIIAGGLYGCSVDSVTSDGVFSLASLAVGPCMSVPTLLKPVESYAQVVTDLAARGWIDPPRNLARSHV